MGVTKEACDICLEHSGLAEAVANLEKWQGKQNGALTRIEAKLDQKFDRLLYWLLGELAAIAILALGVWLK